MAKPSPLLTDEERDLLARVVSDGLIGRMTLNMGDVPMLRRAGAKAAADRSYVVQALTEWLKVDPMARRQYLIANTRATES